mgnify:CR=1 FL=1
MAADNIHDIIAQLKAEAGMDKAASDEQVATPPLEKAGEFAAYLRKLATGEDVAVMTVGGLTEKLASLSPQEDKTVTALRQRIKALEEAKLTKVAQEARDDRKASTQTGTDKPTFPSLRQLLAQAATSDDKPEEVSNE